MSQNERDIKKKKSRRKWENHLTAYINKAIVKLFLTHTFIVIPLQPTTTHLLIAKLQRKNKNEDLFLLNPVIIGVP